MSAADYPCAWYGCDRTAIAVHQSAVGAVYGSCREHLPTLLANERWVHEPDQTTTNIDRWTEYLERDSGSVPCSRYGPDSATCAPWAIACHLIYIEANGDDVDEYDSLDGYMSLVVNDHDDVAYLIREYGYSLPDQLQYLRDEIADQETDQ